MTDHTDFFEQNNQGVTHLINGDMNRAFSYFRAAFEQAKKRRGGNSRFSTTTSSVTRIRNEKKKLQQNHHHQQLCSPWPLLPREQVLETLRIAASSDVRRHGFLIKTDYLAHQQQHLQQHQQQHNGGRTTTTNTNSSSSSIVDMTSASAFVVFNMALVYNISGAGDCNERNITKSRLLFDCCRKLLLPLFQRLNKNAAAKSSKSSSSTIPRPTGNPLVDLLWLTTLTKLIQTNCILSEYDKAQQYSIQLDDFVRQIRISYVGDAELNALLEVHCQRSLIASNSCKESQPIAPAA